MAILNCSFMKASCFPCGAKTGFVLITNLAAGSFAMYTAAHATFVHKGGQVHVGPSSNFLFKQIRDIGLPNSTAQLRVVVTPLQMLCCWLKIS